MRATPYGGIASLICSCYVLFKRSLRLLLGVAVAEKIILDLREVAQIRSSQRQVELLRQLLESSEHDLIATLEVPISRLGLTLFDPK